MISYSPNELLLSSRSDEAFVGWTARGVGAGGVRMLCAVLPRPDDHHQMNLVMLDGERAFRGFAQSEPSLFLKVPGDLRVRLDPTAPTDNTSRWRNGTLMIGTDGPYVVVETSDYSGSVVYLRLSDLSIHYDSPPLDCLFTRWTLLAAQGRTETELMQVDATADG